MSQFQIPLAKRLWIKRGLLYSKEQMILYIKK